MIQLADKPGPLVLIPNVSEDPIIKLAAAMAVGYSKTPVDSSAEVKVTSPDETQTIRVLGLKPGDVKRLLI